MTTMRTIVDGALETAGIIQIGETPSNEDLTYGLGVLNDMLHEWRGDGVDIGHETLGASETVNLLEEHIGAAKVLLALHPRMRERYGFDPSPMLVVEGMKAWSRIYGAYASPAPAPQDGALLRMPLRSEGIGR